MKELRKASRLLSRKQSQDGDFTLPMLGELFNAMKEERRKYYACHPACEYRKRKSDGRLHCLNDDSSVDIIDENANYDLCPLPERIGPWGMRAPGCGQSAGRASLRVWKSMICLA